MEKLIEQLEKEMAGAFQACGYDAKYARVTLSDRPDLCEFQCNGALTAAKEYKKAPLVIAKEVTEKLAESEVFSCAEAVKPGFLNLHIRESFLAGYLCHMQQEKNYGNEKTRAPKTIIIDYGGPNVAKPLHVGHLRSAVIGESIKRMGRYVGHRMIGDVHMGDWGLQMGLIITELQQRRPELIYYDDSFMGEYPREAPFTISELEEIYPAASARSKEDAAYKERAMQATHELQQGRRGYRALLQHILDVSVADLKKNYETLNVSFDLWKGESDAQPYIPAMVKKLKEEGHAYLSDGALVVDVREQTDTKPVPPCMILKSDGASLYNTTDLATIVQRMEGYSPNEIIYVVDKRQELYFTQIFRCARKTGLVGADTRLTFLGFGTMNGKNGKPFKTREGGVMRLSALLQEVHEKVYQKILENGTMSVQQAEETAKIIALSAVKYGDLSNQASKDYIFDVDRFTAFEGNTGPYLLYTVVRIKSILNKYEQTGKNAEKGRILPAASPSEKELMLEAARFNGMIAGAFEELAPHRVCAYLYGLANAFNHFYHETRILTQEDAGRQDSYIQLLRLCKGIMESCMEVLGFSAPDRM
ncbi:MAG: arginine--tRNA ligase [Provencibacterium sp.]|nr:arginine--tRNA ligase [Provencibacterium sp.]